MFLLDTRPKAELSEQPKTFYVDHDAVVYYITYLGCSDKTEGTLVTKGRFESESLRIFVTNPKGAECRKKMPADEATSCWNS